jgi:GNAT superfamily N-acetyltransferase
VPPLTRPYDPDRDFERVSDFLVRTFSPAGPHRNWFRPRWEYMHYHPLIRGVDLARIGIWEDAGEILAVAHPEHEPGVVFFELDPRRPDLKPELLRYAQGRLATTRNGAPCLRVLIGDDDPEFQRAAADQGFEKTDGRDEMSELTIPDPFPPIPLPPGFRLQSLADDNDLSRLRRLLHRGFNHGADPPDESVEGNRLMQSAPDYRLDLQIVAVAPNGAWASYAGLWYEPTSRFGYVEPVCTDPEFRRRGLASAAVLEGVRRCGVLGAARAYVATAAKPLYAALGFQRVWGSTFWRKDWS